MLPPLLSTERLQLVPATCALSDALLAYHLKNRVHLSPWEPARTPDFFTPAQQQARLQQAESLMQAGRQVSLLIQCQNNEIVIGECNFTNIVEGVFMACHLGYSLDVDWQGRGIMYEALNAAIAYMFQVRQLHRIMANHMPSNHRSARLLQRLGFEREGFARAYLKIQGRWEDHVLNSRIADARP